MKSRNTIARAIGVCDGVRQARRTADFLVRVFKVGRLLHRPHFDVERRQVTVMFSKVISAYQECAAETVQRFGGFVAKYMGDGVLVYFGYPHAHEDDAERAVRAGLELVAAVSGLKTHAALKTRVGIATGLGGGRPYRLGRVSGTVPGPR